MTEVSVSVISLRQIYLVLRPKSERNLLGSRDGSEQIAV